MLARNQLGVLYGVASVACFAMMDACVKWLDQFPVGEVLFARFFFGLIPILMLVPKNDFKTFKNKKDIYNMIYYYIVLLAL